MELERISCPYCGGNYDDYNPQAETMTCRNIGCGATFRIPQAKRFASVQIDHETDIKSLRMLLDEAVSRGDEALMERHAQETRRLIPDDAFAAFCEALGQKKREVPKAYAAFLNNAKGMTSWEADRILGIALKEQNFTMHDEEPLKVLIKANFPEVNWAEKEKQVTLAVNRLHEVTDRVAPIPRDVFICHSSRDKIAQEVYDLLSDDGIHCWISERNIPDDAVNYWERIYEAIGLCRIFLVVTSNACMLSEDPQREMKFARRLKKSRLELKIDDAEHTTYFKHFFDGIQWVKLGDAKEQTLEELKERIYLILYEPRENPFPGPAPEPEPEMEPKSGPLPGPEPEPQKKTQAPPSYLSIHYVDSETKQVFQVETRQLQPGEHFITPNPAFAPAVALFGDKAERKVVIGPRGGVQREISFNYTLPVRTISLTVRYVSQAGGEELASEQRQLVPGNHSVIANEDLIPREYRLAGENQQAVSVDRFGADPNEIVFICRMRILPVSLSVRYVLHATGAELASEQRELNPGKHLVVADENRIPAEYSLVGDRQQSVSVDREGTKPPQVIFECQLKVKPVTVKVHFRDHKGKEIAPSASKTLPAGTHKIYAQPTDLPKEYALTSPNMQTVTVTQGGAKPDSVVFVYMKGASGDPIRLSLWQRLGRALVHLFTAAWLLLLVLRILDVYSALDRVATELPFLYSLKDFVKDIYYEYGWNIALLGKGDLFTFMILGGTLLILVVSLPFGLRVVHWNATQLSRWLYLAVLAHAVIIWVVMTPGSSLADGILQDKNMLNSSLAYGANLAYGNLQDKLVFFLEIIVQPLAALLLTKLMKRITARMIRA